MRPVLTIYLIHWDITQKIFKKVKIVYFFFARNIYIAGSTWTSKFIKKILASAAVTFCLASCTLPSSDHKLQNNRCHKYTITLQINRCLHIFKKTEMVLNIAKIAKFEQNDSNNPKFVYKQWQYMYCLIVVEIQKL